MGKNHKPRVALISPQVIGAREQVRKAQPPLGIASLAAVLEKSGCCDLLLIDAVVEDFNNVISVNDNPLFVKFGMSDDKIVDKLMLFEPDLVGISLLFSSQSECSFSLAKAIKKWSPGMPIILGGNNASYMYKEIMEEHGYIDFILVGEADYTFAEFVEKFFKGENYHKTPGLVWRKGFQICKNPKPAFIKNLDRLPIPAFHLYDMEKYFSIGMPHNPFVKSERVGCIITSRGCPQHCYFCSSPNYFGHTFRYNSSKRIIEMVQSLVDNYSIKEVQIMDDNFTLNYKRVIEICEGLKHLKLRITLPNAIRADRPKNQAKRLKMLKSMYDAGVEQIGISVEHGDQDFLNNVINKDLNLEEVITTCELAHEAGILVHANFMMGFPFEKAINRKRTIEYAKKLDADSFSVSLAAPLPGTRMWDIVEKNELFTKQFDVNRMVYVYVNIVPHDISPEELYKVVDKLNRELNEASQQKRPETIEKYKLFNGKAAHGDRKYHFIKK